jgi:hypothetical protein
MESAMSFDRRILFLASCLPGCGDGGDGDDGSGAEAQEQSVQCADYLDCVGIVDPGSIGSLIDSYGPAGSCWDDEESADICTNSCVAAMAGLFVKYPTVEECSNGHGSDLLFGTNAGWSYEATDCDGLKPFSMTGRFHGAATWDFTIDFDNYVGGRLDCVMDPVTLSFACDPFYNATGDYTSMFTGEFEADMTSGTGRDTITQYKGSDDLNWYCEMDATPVP